MDIFNRFHDEGYKNWVKTNMGLQRLRTRLEPFLENETETYHRFLSNKVKLVLRGAECQTQCKIKRGQKMINKVPTVCEVCKPWREQIWDNHTSPGGQVYWNNSTPHLWATHKWEVAKVYMPRGNHNHRTVDQFDISAFLNLMTFCKYFNFVNNTLITEVTCVRNQVMHSPDWSVKKADLETHLQHITQLGRALEERAPELRALAMDIQQLQNTDFDLIVKYDNVAEMQGSATDGFPTPDLRYQEFLREEHQILKDWMENMARRYEEDKENTLTPEELQSVRVFLSGNRDLEEALAPQWKRLLEVQERVELHGRQIHTLTDRVGTLEQNVQAPDPEFGADVLMYKNYLFEEAKRQGWADPVFSEIISGTGKKGCVRVNGREFIGLRVCLNTKKAHQDVAKLALEQLSNHSTNKLVQQQLSNHSTNKLVQPASEEGDASNSQTEHSASVSSPGSVFFGSVTVHVTHVISEEGHAGKAEAVESAYKKLAALFCLDLSQSASSYQEAVQQHCQGREVPPPEQHIQDSSCTLTFTGPITFHHSEGASKKKQAHQRAARVALDILGGVLGKKEVQKENYIGALKELLDAKGWGRALYDHTEGSRGLGSEVMVEEETGESETRTEERGDGSSSGGTGGAGVKGQGSGDRGLPPSPVNTTPVSTDTAIPMETKATPTQSEERSISGNSSRFLGCVKVDVRKELTPHEASSQEEAAQGAYSSLLQALSLGPTATAGGAREWVQEFFRQAECRPPVEDSIVTAEGKHRCTLGIAGQLTFHTQEGSFRKQQAEQLAAKEALSHLEGLLGGSSQGAGENYKGRLQELLVKQGGGARIQYSTTEPQNTATGPWQVSSAVAGSALQTEGPSVKRAVAMETAPEDLNLSPKRFAEMESKGQKKEIGRRLELLGLGPLSGAECEQVTEEQRHTWRVSVALDRFAFRNPERFSSREEAVSWAYVQLGLAGQVCQPGADVKESREAVLMFFSQGSFSEPVELVDPLEDGRFSCSLSDITCLFTYQGEGSSEAAAHVSSLQRALSCLSPLVVYCAPVGLPSSVEEAEPRLRALLELRDGLKLSDSAPSGTLYKNSVLLSFQGFGVENQGERSRKETKAQLSRRLLGLLGEETTSSGSERNCLDEWFLKRGLEKPVFEQTDNKFGTRVTFSAAVTFSTGWTGRREEAQSVAMEEVLRRVRFLSHHRNY